MRRLCVYLSSGRSTYVGRPRLARVADAEKNCYFSSAPDQGDHPGTGDGTNARPERERVPPFGAIRDEAQKQIVIYCKEGRGQEIEANSPVLSAALLPRSRALPCNNGLPIVPNY